MIVLGVNGWMERSHDAAACLIAGERIVAMAEEERFIRQKYSLDKLPLNAVAFCLKQAKITPDDIDVIAWGWDFPLIYSLHGREFPYKTKDLNELLFPRKYYPRKRKLIPVEFVSHHLSHAASVYCARPDEEPICLAIVDGSSEDRSISIYRGQEGMIEMIRDYPMQISPGFFYEGACRYLGFTSWQAGKLMGLACYGEPLPFQGWRFENGEFSGPFSGMRLTANGLLDWEEEIVVEWVRIFESRWGARKKPAYDFPISECFFRPTLKFSARDKNIAASFQVELERIYSAVIQEGMRLTGLKKVGLAGGVSLNCSANGMLLDSLMIDRLDIQPAAGDSGVAIGAAALMLGKIPPRLLETPFLGPGFAAGQIKEFLRTTKVDFSEPDDICDLAARALASGKVVGWFDGRMEFGPRALGGRSILADPRRRSMHFRVNRIKTREQWRPLAPSVILERAAEFFSSGRRSPYMLIRDYARQDKAPRMPAIVHVDGSSRLQTVEPKINGRYWKLLKAFEALTGLPMVLNTSFNSEKEPIVCTPIDALKTFFQTGIDLLVLGPFLIKK